MVDPIDSAPRANLSLILAKQTVELDQAQVNALPQATQQSPQSSADIGPPRVNTGLAGQAPEDLDTAPGTNLDITV